MHTLLLHQLSTSCTAAAMHCPDTPHPWHLSFQADWQSAIPAAQLHVLQWLLQRCCLDQALHLQLT